MSDPLATCIKPPFKADYRGGYVFNADNLMFAEIRGWGTLQRNKDGEKIQDYNLKFMVDAMNEKAAAKDDLAHIEHQAKECGWKGIETNQTAAQFLAAEVQKIPKLVVYAEQTEAKIKKVAQALRNLRACDKGLYMHPGDGASTMMMAARHEADVLIDELGD